VRRRQELRVDETCMVLEGDKATVDFPTPFACTVERILVRRGQLVRSGEPLLAVTVHDAGQVARSEKASNVQTALSFFSSRSLEELCGSHEESVFGALERFFSNAILLSRMSKAIPLPRLPDFLLNSLSSVLFEISEPFRQVQLFHRQVSIMRDSDRERRRRRILAETLSRRRILIERYYEVYDAARRWLKLERTLERVELESIRRQVFVIHGTDEALRLKVVSFLKDQGIEPVVLQDRPDGGLTPIVEEIERYAGVDYAVALLTADDLGKKRGEKGVYQPRARQNVILEIGYFWGRLGREGVTTLYESGVELPSDLRGVRYIEVDAAGFWIVKLAQQLAQVGFEIDLNRLSHFQKPPMDK